MTPATVDSSWSADHSLKASHVEDQTRILFAVQKDLPNQSATVSQRHDGGQLGWPVSLLLLVVSQTMSVVFSDGTCITCFGRD